MLASLHRLPQYIAGHLVLARRPTLLQLLLGAELVGVATLLLAAVHGTRMQASIALTAHHLLTVELTSQHSQRRFNDSAAETKYQVEGRFFLDVVI